MLKNVFSDASLDLDNDEPYLLLTKDEEEKNNKSMSAVSKRAASINIIKPPLASKKVKGLH
jgi:hypothetical protein